MTWTTCECDSCPCENVARPDKSGEAICAECRQGDHALEDEER